MIFIKILNIESYLKPKDGLPGVSHPAKILASDGKEYFLKGHYGKFRDSGWVHLEAASAQELFAYKLAEVLSLPIVNVALVKIEEIDLEVYSELRFTHHIMEKGLYLAVEAVETTTQNLDLLLKEKNLGIPHSRKKVNNFFNKLDNKEDIPKILYFDLLTANIDRYRNLGNLIFKKTNTGNYILAIDFGYCFFGPYWSSKEYYHDVSKRDLLLLNKSNWESFILKACLMNNYFLGSVFNLLNPFIDFKENPFANIHSIALNLTSNNIADMLKEVPDSWLVEGNHQRNMYLNFLLNQIKRMPGILNYAVSQRLFVNNKGGILTWPKEQSMLVQ